jgi:hypothetical protein
MASNVLYILPVAIEFTKTHITVIHSSLGIRFLCDKRRWIVLLSVDLLIATVGHR